MLGIIDYRAGNPTSVRRALQFLGIPCLISQDPLALSTCSGLLFPGVGAAGQAMELLKSLHLDTFLRERVQAQVPLLGICLGCQILLSFSEENATTLLKILPGQCKRFQAPLYQEDGTVAPIPHMGFNTVRLQKDCSLFEGIDPTSAFYFVHSYYTEPAPELLIASTFYGFDFCSVYGRPGLWGVQFHPEKSGRPGLRILENFYRYCQGHHHAQ